MPPENAGSRNEPKTCHRAPGQGQNWLRAAGLPRGSGLKPGRLRKHEPTASPPQIDRPPGGGARPGAPQVAAVAVPLPLLCSAASRDPGRNSTPRVPGRHRRPSAGPRRFHGANAEATPALRRVRPGLWRRFGGGGGAGTEGLAAAGTTRRRGSGPGTAGTCARSRRCGARRLGSGRGRIG